LLELSLLLEQGRRQDLPGSRSRWTPAGFDLRLAEVTLGRAVQAPAERRVEPRSEAPAPMRIRYSLAALCQNRRRSSGDDPAADIFSDVLSN
jgi:hypothetical protein